MSAARLYRVSALASGFVRMWRGWRVILPVVVVNALLQAALVWPAYTYATQWWAVVGAVISALVLLASFGLVASTSLHVADGTVGWTRVLSSLRENLASYVLWAVAWFLAVVVGLVLYTVPAVIVAALTPFLLLAALDGQRNALARNLRTIGRRFWRWLLTVAIIGVVLFVGDLSAGLFTFFVRNPLASLVVWLIAGVVIAWFTTAWALIYRSAWAEPPEQAHPDGEPAPAAPADEVVPT